VSTWEIPSSPDAQAQSWYAPAQQRDLTAVSTHQNYWSQGMGAPVLQPGAPGGLGYQWKQTSAAWLSPGEHLASPVHPVTPFSHRSRQSSIQSSLAATPNTRTHSQKYSALSGFLSLANILGH